MESNPTPQEQEKSSQENSAEYPVYSAEVAPVRPEAEYSDSAIDMDALAGMTGSAGRPHGAKMKLTRKEKREAKRALKREAAEAKQSAAANKKSYRNIKKQLKDRDKELSDRTKSARAKRRNAKDVVSYLGYNRMFEDGICEVEEGLYSSTIALAYDSASGIYFSTKRSCAVRQVSRSHPFSSWKF